MLQTRRPDTRHAASSELPPVSKLPKKAKASTRRQTHASSLPSCGPPHGSPEERAIHVDEFVDHRESTFHGTAGTRVSTCFGSKAACMRVKSVSDVERIAFRPRDNGGAGQQIRCQLDVFAQTSTIQE